MAEKKRRLPSSTGSLSYLAPSSEAVSNAPNKIPSSFIFTTLILYLLTFSPTAKLPFPFPLPSLCATVRGLSSVC
jgi:hypothetical protein